MANDALRRIEDGEPVKPLYVKVKDAFDKAQAIEGETDLARQAREAEERARRALAEQGKGKLKRKQGPPSHFRSVRSFNLTWTELDGWTELYDVDALARQLSRSDWERFDRVVTATIAFRDQLVAARRHASASA